jgi:hypothetical protein
MGELRVISKEEFSDVAGLQSLDFLMGPHTLY